MCIRFFRPQNIKKHVNLPKNEYLIWTCLIGLDQLAQDIPLPINWKDHQLKNNMKRFRECYIGGSGDWLLVYEKRKTDMILYLVATGTHTELLGM